jgi:hypothetical protein
MTEEALGASSAQARREEKESGRGAVEGGGALPLYRGREGGGGQGLRGRNNRR